MNNLSRSSILRIVLTLVICATTILLFTVPTPSAFANPNGDDDYIANELPDGVLLEYPETVGIYSLVPPTITVTTNPVYTIIGTTVTINGSYSGNNLGKRVDYGFYVWHDPQNPFSIGTGNSTSTSLSFSGNFAVAAGLTYYYQAFGAAAGEEPAYGKAYSFTVPSITTYTVTYSGNGNTGGSVQTSQTFTANQNFALRSNTGNLTKTNYSFGGWNTKMDGSGTNYSAGQTVSFAVGNITLYAKWNLQPTYTVTYSGNGNTSGSPPSSQTFYANQSFSLRTNTGNLAKTNYTFNGWNTKMDGSGTNYSAGQQVSLPPGNITLYAKWDSTVSYTVSFTPNGGAPAPPAQTMPSGGTVSQPPSMNYSGHTFGGWYTTSNFAGSPYVFSTPVYSSFTLYAKWVPNSVNLGLTPKGLFDVYSANDENLLIVTEPNISNQQRTGTITVTTQDGTDTIYVYQDGLNSQLSVSKTTISATANGKEDSITINSNISWVALSDADWVELDYAIGIGDDELQLIIDRNDELTPRSATITITGEDVYEEITITQAAYQSTADATLSELTISEGNLYPDFRPGAESYSISVPYNINSITITATPNNSSAFVVGAGTKNLVVGVNIFTITVTAQNGTTTKVHTITVDREQDPNAPINIYTLYFGGEDYWIDAYENMDYPVYIEAYVEDDQGALVTAPELVSLVYTADSGVHNTTGIFTKEDLDISPGEQTNVTATAVLSNGIILQETTVVDAPYIQGRR